MGNKKILRKNLGSQLLKKDAINGKKFVAMQQNSATLIYDLNVMKGTVEGYLKKHAQSFKTVKFQAWKITPTGSSISFKKKTENCYEPP